MDSMSRRKMVAIASSSGRPVNDCDEVFCRKGFHTFSKSVNIKTFVTAMSGIGISLAFIPFIGLMSVSLTRASRDDGEYFHCT